MKPSLDDLQEKIDAAMLEERGGADGGPPVSEGMGMAMRLGVELVAGVGVGTAAGYFLDRWAGTMPLFLIVGFLLGCAAAFLNMKRAVDQLDKGEESDRTPHE